MLLGSIIRDFRKRGKKSLIVKLTFVFFIISTIWLFIFSTPQTDGSSMEPDLHNGEYVILNKIDYKFKTPARGDIIVYKNPQKDNYPDYMGKIIAISGEILQIKEGDVYLNGALLHEPYATGATMPSGEEGEIKEGEELKIPTDMVFVLMNNRQHAIDSRSFGPVPKDHIIGKVYKIPGFYFLSGVSKPPRTGMSGDDLFNVGLYFLNLKNTTKAEEYFIKSGTEFKYVPAFNELGWIYFQKKDYEKARIYYKNALDIEPENPYALQSMGYAYWNTGDTKKAEEYLKKALIAYEKANNPDLKTNFEELKAMIKENGIVP